MAINRAQFFAGIRSGPFPGSMTPAQVEGVNAILDEWERRGLTDLRWLAYMLATAFHETGTTMQPVIETRQPREANNPSVDTAIARLERAWAAGKMPWVKTPYWRKDPAGFSWLGRGLPQVTHKDNYERAERKTGVPFTKDPGLMLQMRHAVPVMFAGMIEGWFTTRKLAHYFSGATTEWREARRIINKLESADKVAGYAKQFHADLVAADTATATAPAALPLPSARPEDKRDAVELGATAGIGATIAAAWQTFIGSGLVRVALALLLAFALYWFVARPILRRLEALDEHSVAGGLLTRLRLAFKGVKTLLWSRLLWIAGAALPVLSFITEGPLSDYLPDIAGIPAETYRWGLVAAAAWITAKLRTASNTPVGQTDLALAPMAAAPPLVPDLQSEAMLEALDQPLKPAPKLKKKRRVRT